MAKITEEHFNSLNLRGRADLVFTQGKHLSRVDKYGFTTDLFSLDALYIQVYYLDYRHTQLEEPWIVRLEVVTSKDIEKYTDLIEIDNLSK
ncbi:MAG TPA: hypothetical protein VD908_03550 [Cytophagales bacterium]|nr:hypothetical protein [Cytophagales bacterium]